MALPFLALYGRTFGDATYCYEEAGRNMAVYFQHLKSDNGLMLHAVRRRTADRHRCGIAHAVIRARSS